MTDKPNTDIAQTQEPNPKGRSPLLAIFLTIVVDLIGFGIVIPILPFYSEHYGATGFEVGIIMAAFSLAQFLVSPLWGRLSDRIGRRPVLLIGLAGSMFWYAALAFADSIGYLILCRAMAGLFNGNISVAQAYIADHTKPTERARGMGVIGAAFGIGFMLGPILGGLTSPGGPLQPLLLGPVFGDGFAAWQDQWGYGVPSFIASAFSLVALIIAWRVLPKGRPPNFQPAPKREIFSAHRLRVAISRPGVGAVLLYFFLMILAWATFESMFAIWAEAALGYDAWDVGWILAFVAFISGGIQGSAIGPLTKRFGERNLIRFACISLAGGLVLFPMASNLLTLMPSMALLIIGFAVSNPSSQSLLSRLTPVDQQGGTLGIGQSLASLSRVIGPLAGGWAFDHWGHNAPFYFGAVFVMAGFVLAMVAVPRPPDQPLVDEDEFSDEEDASPSPKPQQSI